MTRRATDRFLVAAVVTTAGALFAILGGLPEAAVLVTPWAVLLALGVLRPSSPPQAVSTEVRNNRVLVGDEIEVVTIVAGAAGSVLVECQPEAGFLPDDEVAAAPAAVDAIVADQATLRCSLPAQRWGTYDLGRVRLVITEPHGLFRWEAAAGEMALVRVQPTPTDLRSLLAPWLVRRTTGVHPSKAAGRGVEYADIRPYSTGDSLRDINWRASARSPGLWVSQRHPDRATDVVLLVDSFIESVPDVHQVLGLAIEAAIALADSHLTATDRVGLVDLGGVVRWVSLGTGRHQFQRIADALLATGLHASVARRSLRMIPPRALPPRSFVVALSPLLEDRFIRALFLLAAGGHDIAVVECATPTRYQGDDVALGLAYRLLEAKREMVRDRLADSGIVSAQWRPGMPLSVTLGEINRRRRHTFRRSR